MKKGALPAPSQKDTRHIMPSIESQLQQANKRLKGLSLEARGKQNWLYLRGTFPPRPDSGKIRPYQQRIALQIRATAEGLKQAEAIAQIISAKLNLGSFTWDEIPGYEAPGKTIADWMPLFERDFWAGYEASDLKRISTWQGVKGRLNKLEAIAHLEPSEALLIKWVEEHSAPQTDVRKRYISIACKIAEWAEIPQERIKKLAGRSRRSQEVDPKTLPSDQEIEETISALPPGWRYLFGLMAAYGLRNHEVFFVDAADFPVIRIGDRAKTGGRLVKPLPPEWAELWQLDDPILPDRLNLDLSLPSNALGKKLSRMGTTLGFNPYCLRHAYARRCVQYGIREAIAARLMGHSFALHTTTYRRFISAEEWLLEFDRDVEKGKGDRPYP